ncbi:virulence factor SrfB [Dickeya chrysanthemi]|uniref:virulence factor SrfB n=1 Tax=Dickeya chrysanthemi TaxID=556 RepID=UPI0003A5128B|nr:virulence factor SrfB [Dickeya chrysanthemi]
MLASLTDYKEKITLIRDSGIQFLDFGFSLPDRNNDVGEFIRDGYDGTLQRLIYNERDGNYYYPGQPDREVEPDGDPVSLAHSLRLWQGVWLPLPFLRFNPPRHFYSGPSNWARMQFLELGEPDSQGNQFRVTLAFDTRILPTMDNAQYLAPNEDDVRTGVGFALAHQSHELGDFIRQGWVDDWLKELFEQQVGALERRYHEDIQLAVAAREYQAHYLNLLAILGTKVSVPEIKINATKLQDPAIDVDLILDVGNSRTCGILIEDHKGDNKGLTQLYELQLRDLSLPHCVYSEPFDSRVEFAQAEFGKQDFSVKSGRGDAFLWPTIVRIGREANRMASCRLGTEGSTGISSPKRYLWDEDSYVPGWRFNRSFVKSDREPLATAAPLTSLLNDLGEPLFRKKPEERMPVFSPNYSRSALMTMMLSEVLAQALMQINSPAQRLKMHHASAPRQLRNIILTVPPAMPKPERAIFERCMESALGLIWKAMEWHPADAELKFNGKDEEGLLPLPQVHVKWDEATCGQMVYLYNETQNHFGGRTEEFFNCLVRPDNRSAAGEEDNRVLKIASIDIGGGTTDLVITRYQLDDGRGSNVKIIPTQLFREGFKVAGDDILLDVIQLYVMPALKTALQRAGLSDADALMSRLFGHESLEAGKQVLRQQLTLQLFVPIGLEILRRYEEFEPGSGGEINATFAELLTHSVTDNVLNWVSDEVRREQPALDEPFSLLAVPLQLSLSRLHSEFLTSRMNISQSLRALCEVLYYYQCDMLLLTGRPSRLPGIQALFRHLQPVPPSRIMSLHGYETGGWYPFNKKGRIDDPKSTAAVGAMLCLLAQDLRLPNFYFRTANFHPYSTVRYLGMLDSNNMITQDNVYYRDIDLDTTPVCLEPSVSFEVRGALRLGFRQLDNERWPASPLYTLQIKGSTLPRKLAADGVIHLRLEVEGGRGQEESSGSPERFVISDPQMNDGMTVRRGDLSFKLNTLADSGLGETHYWLDSGSVLAK